MAVEITIRGKYYVQSTIAGKKELKDYKVKMAYPVSVDPEIKEEVGEAMFFIKRFLLTPLVKDFDPDEFISIQTAECFHVKDLTDEQIAKHIESGELVAVDVNTVTAADVRAMKKSSQFIKTLILCDTDADHLKEFNDITDLVARKSAMWAGTDVEAKRAELMFILGIQEQAEAKASSSSRKKQGLMDVAKRKRAPRTKAAE